eukprot:1614693-Amphidinium_carterae.1
MAVDIAVAEQSKEVEETIRTGKHRHRPQSGLIQGSMLQEPALTVAVCWFLIVPCTQRCSCKAFPTECLS